MTTEDSVIRSVLVQKIVDLQFENDGLRSEVAALNEQIAASQMFNPKTALPPWAASDQPKKGRRAKAI